MTTADIRAALSVFQDALGYIARVDLIAEIEWQRRVEIDDFSESDLLRETAWVILCSGFRERIVRRVFDHVSLCFCDWESAEAIVNTDPTCRRAAMASFANAAKLAAIAKAAHHVHEQGFERLKRAVLDDPIAELQRFQHIGGVTVWHLAKNLGLNVAKPDRHLVRISNHLGFDDVDHFCGAISGATGEPVKVVDLVVWRYLADNPTAHDSLRY